MEVKLSKILSIYDEVSKNTRNKKKVYYFEKYKMELCSEIYDKLLSNYDGGSYNVFKIYEPKERVIMSQNIVDKVINHYISREVLIPKLEPYLDFRSVATRKNMGISYGRKLIKKYLNIMKNDIFFILKLDISKYFYSINHDVLKSMLIDKLNSYEYKIMCNIIDSVDEGLPIGNMSSQILSVFYLSGLNHYIVHDLKLKYLCIYMDDIIIFHKDKNYLKDCLNKIINYLNKLKLNINKNKTFIISSKTSFDFIGYNYKIINNKIIIKIKKDKYNNIKRKIKLRKKQYYNNIINFESLFSMYQSYKYNYYCSKIDRLLKLNIYY